MAHKKTFLLLLIMVALAGLFFALQIRRARQITVTRNSVGLISEKSAFIPITETDPILGNPGAPITVVEFMDFDCKECLNLHNTIAEFINTHPQDIRLVWKDAPQEKIFSKSLSWIHEIGWCVAQQNEKKFWQFADSLQQNNRPSESEVQTTLTSLNIDSQRLNACLNNGLAKQKLAESTEIFKALNLKTLPAIFVNNKLINTQEDINLNEMLETFIKK